MKIHTALIMAMVLGIAVAPVHLVAGDAQAATGARIVFYVA